MTKKEAIKVFGTKRKLAAALDVSVQAVNAWADKEIPKLREYQINELKAKRDVFNGIPT